MENIFGRHRNITVLAIVLAAQFLGLAVQIKRTGATGDATPLIRTWVITIITPFEKAFVHTSAKARDLFSSYFYLVGVRKENEGLKQQIEQMRVEQVRLQQDAAQARRLQALLSFKEQFISETVPAQVIGTSGSDVSRLIYIDKGTSDGVHDNMAVITPDGIVGKVAKAFHSSSQVLLITDPNWGVGAILTQTRLQGIVKGTQSGAVQLAYIMSDEAVKPGEPVVTSGGDRIFPKGLPIGTVKEVSPGKELFLNVRINPAADLNRLEEVLVITKIVEKQSETTDAAGPIRAADILAQRLPTFQPKTSEDAAKTEGAKPVEGNTPQKPGGTTTTNPPAATKSNVPPPVPGVGKPSQANPKPSKSKDAAVPQGN